MSRIAWEWFTGFVGSGLYRARLNKDRYNAWVWPPRLGHEEWFWSVDDNTRGGKLDYGHADSLESAQRAAEDAATRLGLV